MKKKDELIMKISDTASLIQCYADYAHQLENDNLNECITYPYD